MIRLRRRHCIHLSDTRLGNTTRISTDDECIYIFNANNWGDIALPIPLMEEIIHNFTHRKKEEE
jgi:hypothetical protein